MALETGSFIGDLVSTNPPDTDSRSQGAGHLRLIKSVLQGSFPGDIKMILGMGVAGGTASAMTLSLTPDPVSPTDGALLLVKAVGPNIIAVPTLNINAHGAIAITKDNGTVLLFGDIKGANHWMFLVYNGTSSTWDLLNPKAVYQLGNSSITGNVTLTNATIAAVAVVSDAAAITLPAASIVVPFVPYKFKSITTKSVTLVPAGADQIDGVNAAYRLPAFHLIEIMSTGSAWLVTIGSVAETYVGQIKAQGVATAKIGWQLCDLTSLDRTTFGGLFAEIGTTWGNVDGTHFNAPDFRSLVIVGAGTGPSLSARAIGATGGEETHILTIPEMPSHTHGISTANIMAPTGGNPNSGPGNVALSNPTGGGGAHNNMQPFGVAAYVVKL